MFGKTRIGMGAGQFVRHFLTRETCTDCGQFTRVYVNDGYQQISYHCANPNCGEEKIHGAATNFIQCATTKQED